MAVLYGHNVPSVAEQCRRAVKEQVESLTGLVVRAVNVLVTDIDVPGGEPCLSRSTPARRRDGETTAAPRGAGASPVPPPSSSCSAAASRSCSSPCASSRRRSVAGSHPSGIWACPRTTAGRPCCSPVLAAACVALLALVVDDARDELWLAGERGGVLVPADAIERLLRDAALAHDEVVRADVDVRVRRGRPSRRPSGSPCGRSSTATPSRPSSPPPRVSDWRASPASPTSRSRCVPACSRSGSSRGTCRDQVGARLRGRRRARRPRLRSRRPGARRRAGRRRAASSGVCPRGGPTSSTRSDPG